MVYLALWAMAGKETPLLSHFKKITFVLCTIFAKIEPLTGKQEFQHKRKIFWKDTHQYLKCPHL
jgi:hypothetical protein